MNTVNPVGGGGGVAFATKAPLCVGMRYKLK